MLSSTSAPSGIKNRSSRLPSLTGMRFIAAGMVFFFHVSYEGLFASGHVQHVYSSIVNQAGFSGVSFFFILSGFVLCWSARPSDTTRAFWRRRFFKIYPNHVLTFAVAALLFVLLTPPAFSSGTALLNVFLLQSWVPRPGVLLSFNNVSWSLCCEVLFYLSFPLLLRYIKKIRPERLWAVTIATVVGIFLIPVLADALPGQPAWGTAAGGLWRFWFVYMLPPVRVLDFVLGILVARIVITGRRFPISLGGATVLAIAAYAAAPHAPPTVSLVAVTALPLALLIGAGAIADVNARPTWLSSRPMVWLGEISFAFYMVHWLVLNYGHELLGAGQAWSTLVAVGIIALLLAVTLLLSWLIFTCYERPIMRRFARARRAVQAREPGAVVEAPANASVEG